jgi:hypothetical protein
VPDPSARAHGGWAISTRFTPGRRYSSCSRTERA